MIELRMVLRVEKVTLSRGDYAYVELEERTVEELEDVPAFFLPDGSLTLVDRDGVLRPDDEIVMTIRATQEAENATD